jgi:hypothetical protein
LGTGRDTGGLALPDVHADTDAATAARIASGASTTRRFLDIATALPGFHIDIGPDVPLAV